MEVQLFDSNDPILIIGFLATFELTCDTNKTQEGAAMWIVLCFVEETIADALNSRMCNEDQLVPLTTTVR